MEETTKPVTLPVLHHIYMNIYEQTPFLKYKSRSFLWKMGKNNKREGIKRQNTFHIILENLPLSCIYPTIKTTGPESQENHLCCKNVKIKTLPVK